VGNVEEREEVLRNDIGKGSNIPWKLDTELDETSMNRQAMASVIPGRSMSIIGIVWLPNSVCPVASFMQLLPWNLKEDEQRSPYRVRSYYASKRQLEQLLLH
jgi:hypothetical protein